MTVFVPALSVRASRLMGNLWRSGKSADMCLVDRLTHATAAAVVYTSLLKHCLSLSLPLTPNTNKKPGLATFHLQIDPDSLFTALINWALTNLAGRKCRLTEA